MTGLFSRSGVEVLCAHSLTEGDPDLHLTVRIRALREFDDHEEVDWITSGPLEMLGDRLQSRRVLRRVMESLTTPTNADPEGYGTGGLKDVDPKLRRERFRARYAKSKKRHRVALAGTFLLAAVAIALQLWP